MGTYLKHLCIFLTVALFFSLCTTLGVSSLSLSSLNTFSFPTLLSATWLSHLYVLLLALYLFLKPLIDKLLTLISAA